MNEQNKLIIDKVRTTAVKSLADKVVRAIDEASRELAKSVQTGTTNIYMERASIAERFSKKLNAGFHVLTGERDRKRGGLDYSSLSLVEEEDLEAIIALEGMVAHARNTDISEYLSFTTRLNTLFYGVVIDESNNPLDPEQIGEAFRDAMRPIKMDARSLLVIYRNFNTCVFHELEQVLEQANDILIEHNIIPNLDIAARNKKLQQRKRDLDRPSTNAVERAFLAKEEEKRISRTQSSEMLNMLRTLMQGVAGGPAAAGVQGGAGAGPGAVAHLVTPAKFDPGMTIGGKKVQVVPHDKLFEMLSALDMTLMAVEADTSRLDLTEALEQKLREGERPGVLHAIDSPSAEIIDLVSMLFKAIWNDPALPVPIKELIGRLQVTVVKLALTDPAIFNNHQHPIRVMINEFSLAGIGWTEMEKLAEDPVYRKMRNLITRAITDYKGDVALFQDLLDDFRDFQKDQLTGSALAEQMILGSGERHQRLEEIKSYVKQKIQERILDQKLDPLVDELLTTHLQKFLVKLVLKEGPGGPGWKPVINTIDVLLWTVQPVKQDGDRRRFDKINPRLVTNLGKALKIAGLSQSETDELLAGLRNVQLASFETGKAPMAGKDADEDFVSIFGDEEVVIVAAPDLPPLAADDEHLRQVDHLPVGIWVEFKGDENSGIRCTLAARIDTIDKFVFVNRQGVKVVEKSRMGLARELKQGTVKLISDGPLFERALETVFSGLRDSGERQAAAAAG